MKNLLIIIYYISYLFVQTICSHLTRAPTFDFFMYAQHYPPTICLLANKAKMNSCAYPKNIDQFTVHGLWPSDYEGKSPMFCAGSKFDVDKLKDLRKDLEKSWPNLVPEQAIESFWKYEWNKHGKCALSNPLFRDEHDYFYIAMALNVKIDLYNNLKKQGIIARLTETYTYKQIDDALIQLGHPYAKLECAKERETDNYYLAAIRLCYNFNMSAEVSCNEDYDYLTIGKLPGMIACPVNGSFIYPPFDDEKQLTIIRHPILYVEQRKMTIMIFVILSTSLIFMAFVKKICIFKSAQNSQSYRTLTEDFA